MPPDVLASPLATGRHPTLEETAALAGHLHAGQTDKAGAPYVGHLARVAANLGRLFPEASLAERHAAWLHDAVEDTPVEPADLAGWGYAPEVIRIVLAVTKRPDDARPYAERIEALAASGDVAAMRVKIADLTDNADPSRLALLGPDRAASLGGRYRAALARLEAAVAARDGPSDERAPTPQEHVPVTVALEPLDHLALAEAARLADRTVEAFVAEEIVSLAHHIVATGSLRHVDLARDRQARFQDVVRAFRGGPVGD